MYRTVVCSAMLTNAVMIPVLLFYLITRDGETSATTSSLSQQNTDNTKTQMLSASDRKIYSDAEKIQMLPIQQSIKQYNINCTKLFDADQEEIKKARSMTDTNHAIPDRMYLDMTRNCTQFRAGRYMEVPVNTEEAEFPIAYIIQMYQDVYQLERLLMAIYRPQNVYCINVDLSAHIHVHLAMTAIATCFNNVFITNVDVQWSTFSQVEADLTCMQLLYRKAVQWRYVITLAGQMYPLRTNLDIVRVLKALNGSNAVEASVKRIVAARWERSATPPYNITMVKGGCTFAVTRSFVKFVLYDSRVERFRDWAMTTYYPDEHFFQSISHSPQWGVPGAYTGLPENGVAGYDDIMRHTMFTTDTGAICHGKFVHTVCVFGVADLTTLATDRRHLFVNKLHQNYQPAALWCLEQRHYDWTRQDILGITHDTLDLQFYRNLPNVKHHIPSGVEGRDGV